MLSGPADELAAFIVKEKLVARPQQWPGVHSAKALMTGARLEGEWLDGTAYSRAKDAQSRRKRPKAVRKAVVEQGRIARGGQRPLGVKRVLAIPLNHRSELPPQPWFENRKRRICWGTLRDAEVQLFIDEYWQFQRAFRAASDAYRNGDVTTVLPRYAFKPAVYHPPELAA